MNKEIYTTHTEEVSLNVVNSEIESIRNKNIRKNAVRVYKDNKIGISGALGDLNEDQLTEKAVQGLSLNIPYPYEISADNKEEVHTDSALSDPEAFVKEAEELVGELKEAQPDFVFSNKINMKKESVSLKNDAGLDLRYSGTSINAELIIKERGSANILDAFTGYEGHKYDRKEFLRFTNMICDAYKKPVSIDPGEYPVFFFADDRTYYSKIIESLHGLLYGTGGSLLAGKLNETVFSEKLNIVQTRNFEDGIYAPFFDFEGSVNNGFRKRLISNGKLEALATDKKTASKYSLPHTGSAGGDYDSVPSLAPQFIHLEKTGNTMKEMTNGQKAIFVFFAMGGDFTPDGHFASPVQLAYLFDGEHYLGKLPELNISGSMWDMFGKDFIGVSDDSLTTLADVNATAIKMRVDLQK